MQTWMSKYQDEKGCGPLRKGRVKKLEMAMLN